MKVTFSTLLSHVKNGVKVYTSDLDARVIGVLPIKTLASNYNEEYLYVGKYSDLGETALMRNISLLVYIEDYELFPPDFQCNVILTDNEKVYSVLVKSFCEELLNYARYSDVSNQLFDCIQKGQDLHAFTRHIHKLLANPVMIVDILFNCLSYTGTEGLNDEPIWEYAIKNNKFPDSYINKLIEESKKNNQSLEDINNSSELLINEAYSAGIRRIQYSAKIVIGKQVVGYIKVLEKNHKLTDFEKKIILLISRYLSLLLNDLYSIRSYNFSQTELLLQSILMNDATDDEISKLHQSTYNIKLFPYISNITISLVNPPSSSDEIYYLYKRIKNFFSNHFVILIDNRFVIFYDTESKRNAKAPQFQKDFESFLKSIDCYASISTLYRDPWKAKPFYQQTINAIELRTILYIRKRIIYYTDLIEYDLILTYSKHFDPALLVHPMIHKLLKIDHDNDSKLTSVLFAYIKNSQEVSTTAKELFMHYNTLRYQLNRIIEITGMDFDDERLVFRLLLSKFALEFTDSSALFAVSEST